MIYQELIIIIGNRIKIESNQYHQIELEKEMAHKARLALRRETETLEQKREREEFQRKQAIYCNCPEMDPNWRDLPNYSEIRDAS
jgi:hypothetical protein